MGSGVVTRPPRAASCPPAPTSRGYARYVLGVLVLVYVFNFLDRQILAILAERIKADLRLDDAQLGFLYGTSFAVFYAVFGIPLGKLADVWDRRKLISLGLALWSGMTALSGFARSLPQLAAARVGVGIGEASATPAAYSLLSDYFPRDRRASVLAIYSSGIFIGAGLGLGLGGWIVDRWDSASWPGAPPLGLRGWQVAFLAMGTPGLILAVWVHTLREPARGHAEELPAAPEPRPFRAFATELASVIPPFTLIHLSARGGARAVICNLAAAGAIGAAATAFVVLFGAPPQWITLGAGTYSAVSWAQSLALRDPGTFRAIFRNRPLCGAALGFSLISFAGYALTFWTPSFFLRAHGLGEAEAGLWLGGIAAGGGFIGVNLGGLAADRWRRLDPRGSLYVGALGALATIPVALGMLTAKSTTSAYGLAFATFVSSSAWLGPGASTVQELVTPAIRGRASAAYLFAITLLGLALGPFAVGRLSEVLGDLRGALALSLIAYVFGAGFLVWAWRQSRNQS
jgi:MFS family permease